jgi:microcin C transport system permease protein
MISRFVKNPMTRRRLSRFKEMKRAYISLWILALLYMFSLCSEIICNNVPLYVKFQDKSYFPVFKFYPEDTFLVNGKLTRPDYHQINTRAEFLDSDENYMVFPPIPYSPFQSLDPKRIDVSDHVIVKLKPLPLVGTANIRNDRSIAKSFRLGSFLGLGDKNLQNKPITDYVKIPLELASAIELRFQGKKAPSFSMAVTGARGEQILAFLSTHAEKKHKPKTVRITFREGLTPGSEDEDHSFEVTFNRDLAVVSEGLKPGAKTIWDSISDSQQLIIKENIRGRYFGPVDTLSIPLGNRKYRIEFIKEDVRFPFRPVKGHIMGIDGAGRDVLSRILYGLRTSMSFGLLLVVGSMALGIAAGALQGYFGGLLDISGQRFIEIWSALPFLYIMILMGSIYGRSFSLLLFCYGLFNWIGISYYIRAEFLRLRKLPFVEAAKCMGGSSFKIIFKHILPNGMVPVITFFPFSLVGAIGSLAALDYLGFGLPSPTPSWGELLYQAQQYRWAWWLILYPSISLFTVMLLGVFVGEGVRNAYDPKRYTRLV